MSATKEEFERLVDYLSSPLPKRRGVEVNEISRQDRIVRVSLPLEVSFGMRLFLLALLVIVGDWVVGAVYEYVVPDYMSKEFFYFLGTALSALFCYLALHAYFRFTSKDFPVFLKSRRTIHLAPNGKIDVERSKFPNDLMEKFNSSIDNPKSGQRW